MSFTPAFPDDNAATMVLDLEDFRRLGVRPFECRQSVIRLAALRNSRPLAKQQLVSPTEQGHLQLARLVTSTYRLLDPRGRQDAIQRALVGRIMPQDLVVAGRTHFVNHNGLPEDQARTMAHESDVDDEFQHGLAGETETQPTWTISLCEGDLVRRNSVIGRIGHAGRARRQNQGRSRSWSAWWIFVSSLAVVLIAMGFLTYARRGTASANRTKTPTVDDQHSSRPAVQRAGLDRPSQFPIIGPSRDDQSPQAQPDLESSKPGDFALQSELPPSNPAVQPRVKLAPMLEIERAGSETADVVKESTESLNIDPPIVTGDASMPTPATVDPPEVSLFQVPEPRQVDSARRRIVQQVSALSKSIAIDSIDTRMEAVAAFADQQTIGSQEHWTALQIIGEHTWLVNPMEEVSDRINELFQNYDFDQCATLTSTFGGACRLARLPATHQHLAAQGLLLCDRLLCEELPTECRHVLDLMTELDSTPEHQIRQAEFADSVELMERFAVSTDRWRSVVDPRVPTADTGIAGRYYCLMLRQWDTGLPWLVDLSDKRLARLAADELSVTDIQGKVEIANRWLDLAERFQGRSAHSIRLHAIDLLNQSTSGSSEVLKLEIDRSIDDALTILPLDLRRLASQPNALIDVPPINVGPDSGEPESSIADKSSMGLTGRLRIDGQDAGVRVNYQPGATIDSSFVQTVMQRLDRDGESISLELEGKIELPSNTQVSIALATKAMATQEIRIDGDLIPLDDFDQDPLVDLQSGTRTIRWTILSNPVDRLFLIIRDADTGQLIPVAYQTPDQERPAMGTINIRKSAR